MTELLGQTSPVALSSEIPGAVTMTFDGITETRFFNMLMDEHEFRWDFSSNGNEHHLFDRLTEDQIQDAGGFEVALQKMRERVKAHFANMVQATYSSYIKAAPTPYLDYLSIPEHPAYVPVKVSDIAAGASNTLGSEIHPEGMKRLIEEMNKMFPAQPAIPTKDGDDICGIIKVGKRLTPTPDILPPFLTPAPNMPPQSEEKGWQPDQINDSLLKGRIRDW